MIAQEEKGQFVSTASYHYEGALIGGNPSPEGLDMGFDTAQEAKDKFLSDLEKVLNHYGKRTEMHWRRIPVLVEARNFDLDDVRYTYVGRVDIKVRDK